MFSILTIAAAWFAFGYSVTDIVQRYYSEKRITEILYNQGYILKYKFEDDSKQGVIKIALKYDPNTKEPAIKTMERVSRPGLRQYAKPLEFKRVKNGLGIAIVSTSKGVMTDKDAKAQNVGGEVLCHVY